MLPVSGFFDRLTRPPDEVRADNLRAWVSSISGTTPIRELRARERQKVAGVVQNIRIDPRQGSGSIEAKIIDGTGSLTVRWLGRQRLLGVRLGAGLVVEGIVGEDSKTGYMILNPEYDLVPDPEHG